WSTGSLRQANPNWFDDGPELRHGWQHDHQWPQNRRYRKRRPRQAGLGQKPAGSGLRRRQGGPCCGSNRLSGGFGHAPCGRRVQKDFAGRACRGRLDHGRQVEQIHFPHWPQQQPGR
ncbi:Uncharacterized protein APZ42_002948, partial [Daphnia magna]